jgi:hypothetical protein
MTELSSPRVAAGQPSAARLPGGVAVAAWLLALVASPLVVSPGTDDGFYAMFPVGFFFEHSLGTYYLDEFKKVFYVFPGYFFLQALFYYPAFLADLSYDWLTARSHQIVICGLLILATARLVARLSDDGKARLSLRVACCLALLGVTPFAQDAMNIRPEPAGLLATVAGLLSFHKALTVGAGRTRWLGVAAVAVASAATMHPTFIFTSGGIGLASLIIVGRRFGQRAVLLPLAAAVLPLLAMAGWYLANMPDSWNALAVNAGNRTLVLSAFGQGLVTIVNFAFFLDPTQRPQPLSLASLYQAGPYQALFWVLIASGFAAVRLVRRTEPGPRRDTVILIVVFLLMAVLNILLNTTSRVQFYVVLGFPAVLLSALAVPERILDAVLERGRARRLALLTVVVVAVLANPLAHFAKHVLAAEPRFHPLPLAAAVRPAIGTEGRLFFSDDRFLLALVDRKIDNLKGDSAFQAHWVLPYFLGDRALEDRIVAEFICDLAGAPDRSVIWIVSANRLGRLDRSDQLAEIESRRYAGSRRLQYLLRYDNILYEAHNVVALKGKISRVTETLPNGEQKVIYRSPSLAPTC